MDFRATADHKSSSTLKSTKSTASNTANPRILESFAGSLTFLAFPKADSSPKILESKSGTENHKTRHNRNFFSKSTASDFALESTFSHNAPFLSLRADLSAWRSIQKTAQLLESTFSQSHDSKSHAHSLSSRDLRQQVVAIHKGAKANSSNAADFTTAKNKDSSLEAMDCHAIATALARNDKKNAASKKVDSRSEAQNLKTPAKDSRIFDKTAQSVFDSHQAGGRIFLKKHRRNLSGIPCFDTNAELQKVDSSKQAPNVSKQPQDSRFCDEKPLLCKPRKEIRLAVYRRSAAQRSKVYRAKPNPQAQKPTPKPKPQRLPL